jgi:hypothetical protein
MQSGRPPLPKPSRWTSFAADSREARPRPLYAERTRSTARQSDAAAAACNALYRRRRAGQPARRPASGVLAALRREAQKRVLLSNRHAEAEDGLTWYR